MHIYLLRHGQQHNPRRYSRSELLTPLGEAQAARLGSRLQALNIARLYSSDLPRAVQTAQAIQQHLHTEIVLVPELREIDFGEWEGLDFEAVDARYADFKQEFAQHQRDLPYPGGECGGDVQKRAFQALEAITLEAGDAAVVTHGGVILTILCTLRGLGLERRFGLYPLDHCGISILNYDPANRQYTIDCVNDTSHLK